MSIILDGFDLTDNEPDWWGWRLLSHGAAGNVDPDARVDFFAELALVAGTVPLQYRPDSAPSWLRTTRELWIADTDAGRAVVGHSRPRWTYAGDDPKMLLYICCAARGSIETLPAVEDTGAVATNESANVLIPLTVGAQENRAIYVAVLMSATDILTNSGAWHPAFLDIGTPGAGQDLTLLDRIEVNSRCLELYRLLAPDASTEATSSLIIQMPNNGSSVVGAWVLSGVDQTTPERDVATASGTGTATSVTVGAEVGDLVLDAGGWFESNATITPPNATGGQTEDWTLNYDNSFGRDDAGLGGGHGTGSTPTWDISDSHPWLALAVAVRPA